MSLELSALLVAWIVIILLAFALSGLMRQMRMLQDAIGFRRVTVGPAVGSFASSLNDTRLDGPTVLLFLDNDCEVCTRAADELAIQAEIAGEFDFVAVYRQKSNGHRVPHAKTIANASEAFGNTEFRSLPLQ